MYVYSTYKITGINHVTSSAAHIGQQQCQY